jgi:hypothetical protein
MEGVPKTWQEEDDTLIALVQDYDAAQSEIPN